MWQAFQRYRALDPQARNLFWRAVFLLPWSAISLRLRGFNKTRAALQKHLAPTAAAKTENCSAAVVVQTTCRMVKAGAHYGIARPTCLGESLTLWYLLQKQDVPAALRIGVRKVSEKFEAHAWVEYAGAALNQQEEPHQHYAAFDSGFSDLPGEKS
jgi:transglutaminase superfamily protein